jgi:hypothetical protein
MRNYIGTPLLAIWGIFLIAVFAYYKYPETSGFAERGGTEISLFMSDFAQKGALSGVLYAFLSHACAAIIAVVTVFAFAGCGAQTLRALGFRFKYMLEEALLGFITGWWILGAAMFAASAAGFINFYFSAVFIALMFTVGANRMLEMVRALPASIKAGWKESRTVYRILFIAAAAVSAAAFLAALTPPSWLDELVYHLGVPKTYMRAGGMVEIPGNFYSYFPMQVEMVYLWCLTILGAPAARLVNFMAVILAALAVYSLARRLGAGKSAVLAGVLFLTLPVCAWVQMVASVDGWCALTLACAAIAFLEYHSTGKAKWLILSGFALGAFAASKYTGFYFVALGFVVLMIRDMKVAAPIRLSALGRWALFGAAALLPVAPYLVRNLLWTGNPLYPFFFGGKGLSALDMEGLEFHFNDFGSFGLDGILKYLLAPWNFSIHANYVSEPGMGIIGPAFLFLGLAAILARKSPIVLAAVLAGLGALLLWAAGTLQARFLLPPLAILAPALAAAVGRAGIDKIFFKTAVFFCIIFILMNSAMTMAYVSNLHVLAPAAGLETEAEYQRKVVDAAGAYQFINEHTKPGSRVLLLHMGANLYLLERDSVAETIIENRRMKKVLADSPTPEKVRESLVKDGITHIAMYNQAVFHPTMGQYTEEEKKVLVVFFNKFCKVMEVFPARDFGWGKGQYVVFEILERRGDAR